MNKHMVNILIQKKANEEDVNANADNEVVEEEADNEKREGEEGGGIDYELADEIDDKDGFERGHLVI